MGVSVKSSDTLKWERSGSMVEYFNRDREAAGSSLSRRHCVVSLNKTINPSLVLVQPRKTRPFITGRLLIGRKESNKKHLLKFLKLFKLIFGIVFLLLIWENEFAIKPLKESNRRSLTVTALLSWVGLCILWFYIRKYQKAQPAVALVLNILDDGPRDRLVEPY